jgi:Cytochrome oxidase complex assembly protein 1
MMRDPQVLTEPKAIPPEIDRWNWGAFLLNWIWGVGNNTFIALLTLIPVVGIVMLFVLGAKGSRWAWRNGRWESVAHFKRVQRLWAIWGAIIWIGVIALFGGLIGGSFYLLRHSEAYQLGVSKVQASPVAVNILGTPISAGYPLGSINFNGGSGTAVLSFAASGPKAAGVVLLEAVKKDGVWSITRLMLKINGRDSVIDLVNDTKNNST